MGRRQALKDHNNKKNQRLDASKRREVTVNDDDCHDTSGIVEIVGDIQSLEEYNKESQRTSTMPNLFKFGDKVEFDYKKEDGTQVDGLKGTIEKVSVNQVEGYPDFYNYVVKCDNQIFEDGFAYLRSDEHNIRLPLGHGDKVEFDYRMEDGTTIIGIKGKIDYVIRIKNMPDLYSV